MDDLGVPLFLETSKLQNPGEIPRIEATTWEIRRGRNSDSGNDHGKQTENNESGSGKKKPLENDDATMHNYESYLLNLVGGFNPFEKY